MKRKLTLLLSSMLVCLLSASLVAQTPFERMDLDDDGKLSRSEHKGPPRAFRKMDQNDDGYITRKEAAGTRLLGRAEKTARTGNTVPTTQSTELIYVDTHNHLVGPRKAGQYNLEGPAEIALEAMNATGVKLNLLMPMPQAVNQKLQLCFEDLLPILKKYPDRFAALGGGGSLNVMIQQSVEEGQVTTAMEEEFDRRALELVREGAVGFGEMTAEHFSMSAEHPYEAVSPDHPLFLRLADLAARHDVPIDIHMEAIPEAMPMPSRFKSPPNPRMLKSNIAAFEKLLAHNRKANIVWVHLGWDNTGKRTIDLTRRLLAENPNLYLSIRIASGMRARKVVTPTFPLDVDGRLKQEWLALFQDFPERFVIGSDEIIKPDNKHPSAGSIRSTVSILEQLPFRLKSQIGCENAYSLYKLPK